MFYENLKKLCLERGISVSKMATNLKISTTTVTGWRRGAKPRPESVKKIAEYLEVSTEEVMYGEKPAAVEHLGLPDDKADLIGIIKSQQEVIKSQQDTISRNFSESSNHMTVTTNITESHKEVCVSHKYISNSNLSLAESVKILAEKVPSETAVSAVLER